MRQRLLVTSFLVVCLFGKVHVRYRGVKGDKHKDKEPRITLAVSFNGYCDDPQTCLKLRNCTTVYGNLIIRQSQENLTTTKRIKPYFPHLREITGYLVIGLFNQDRFTILPALTVIRGQYLLQNYALIVFYCIELKGIDFSALTTILHGGVRIERNNKLCYVDGIRWESIVKDKHQFGEFGIVVSQNNPNCDTSCVKRHCKVVAGHGKDPNAQHCWGPGGNGSNHQCQKFCNALCGLSGCVEGSTSKCCSDECLGGCAASNSTRTPCYACKHYRIEESGKCVKKCPKRLYLVNNLTCERSCPGWNVIIPMRNVERQYSLDGKCVPDCPYGHRKEERRKKCEKCRKASDCPKICKLTPERGRDGVFYNGSVISVPQDIVRKGIAGCTTIKGSLTLELKEGTGVLDMHVKQLGSIREIIGHLKVHKTTIEYINFFPNLEKLDPPESELLFKKYALAVYDNSNLVGLWSPNKNITATRGMLLAKSNPHLCPSEINKLRMRILYENKTKIEAYTHTNGHRAPCDIKRLQMNVTEVNPLGAVKLSQKNLNMFLGKCLVNRNHRKCLLVTWYYNIDSELSSHYKNIIFFTIYYRKLKKNERLNLRVGNDYVDTENWESVDVPKDISAVRKVVAEHIDGRNTKKSQDSKIIVNIVPNEKYAFYVKEVTLGKSRFSRIHVIPVSSGIPSAPLGFEASFLSNSSIHIKWREPGEPNGEIIKYQIYWKKVSYSYWKDKQFLNWCDRNVKLAARLKTDVKKNNSVLRRGCRNSNFTSTEKEKDLNADRDGYSFMLSFKENFNEVLFTKPTKRDDPHRPKRPLVKKSSKTMLSPPNRKKIFRKSKSKSKFQIPNVRQTLPSVRQTALDKKNLMLLSNPSISDNLAKPPNAEVDGNVFASTIPDLQYFQDYIFTICACTKVGCAKPDGKFTAPCASTQASTGASTTADDLDGDIVVLPLEDGYYNISWIPPRKPNAIVLKYQIKVNQEYSDEYSPVQCHVASRPPYKRFKPQVLGVSYIARVRAISPAGNGSWSLPYKFYVRDGEKEKGQILVVGVSVGCAVIVVFMFAIVLYYALFQRNIERGAPGVLYASVNPEYVNSSEVYIPDEWELNREKIELLQEIGQGSFGMVYEGIAHDINGVLECRVAVKTVNENATIRDRIQFLQEASIMKAFRSNHVTKLIGVVSQGQPTFVVMELMDGDLQSFLRNRRPEDHPTIPHLMRHEVILMAAQIADGMAYLSARKYVHRDLAARNCFVANNRTVKIGDFGLARDIYETDYYRKGGKGLLPVRWMAPESLKDGIFTTSSDVWSFGVVIWEIVTYALQPYQGKSNEELLYFVTTGGCLKYPHECDELMKQLMDLSWQNDPKLRPSFLEVVRMLEDYVSDDFFKHSFYHEMKRKAFEDSMCHESDLHDLLGRPNSSKSKKKGKLGSKTCVSMSSIDSGAYIENFKPDQTPELSNTRKNLLNGVNNNQDDDEFNKETFALSEPLLSVGDAEQFHREDSYYDNDDSDVNMTFGDTPVLRHHHNTSSDEGSGELKISKIFFGKPVPV